MFSLSGANIKGCYHPSSGLQSGFPASTEVQQSPLLSISRLSLLLVSFTTFISTMKSFLAFGVTLLGLSAPLVSGAALKAEPLGITPADALEKRQSCVNGPTSRNCWLPGFDANTDMYSKWPNTGRTVVYDFSITNTTCNPDGNGARVCMLINGKMPGPTIIANWGECSEVILRCSLPDVV